MKKLLLLFFLFSQLAVAADAINRDETYVTIPSAQTTMNPIGTKTYRIAPNWLFKTIAPGPAELRTSTAWSLANEFVFRTNLRNVFLLPASSAGPEGKGGNLYIVTFERKGGGKRLKLQVEVENRTVRIVDSTPVE